jgi:UDP-N-acetylmuramyl pentapeptide phosphotransferase/UDP-N-acetylglucosamine-1-phosphate transferase
LLIGVVDDYFKANGKEFPAWPRSLVYIAAASLVFAVGVRFYGMDIPFTDEYFHFPLWLQYILTVLWIFGVITVVNWSDGLDGLAGSLCTITSITFFIVAMYMGEGMLAMLTLMLVGVTTGFLKYNLFPAKIFMGDSGTTFLGYMIAVISVYGLFKQATVVSIFIPVLALGVPMFDGLFVAAKRLLNKQPPHKADRTHMHHRLLKTGLTPVQAFMFLVLLSVVLNLVSVIIMLLVVDAV